MNNLSEHINNYLDWCKKQKRLDSKTLKSYRIDLQQFLTNIHTQDVAEITPRMLEYEIENMHQNTNPKQLKEKSLPKLLLDATLTSISLPCLIFSYDSASTNSIRFSLVLNLRKLNIFNNLKYIAPSPPFFVPTIFVLLSPPPTHAPSYTGTSLMVSFFFL